MDFASLNVLDLFIGIFIVVSVLRGVRTGFLAGVFSLVGVVVGASVGSRIAPSLLPDGGNPIYGAGITLGSIFVFYVHGDHLDIYSFPTRRPSRPAAAAA